MSVAKPKSPVKREQERLLRELARRFGTDCAKEWWAFSGLNRHYSPRLDLAVGPFAMSDLRHGADYDALCKAHRPFLERLWRAHEANLLRFEGKAHDTLDNALSANWNARCFLAIEIENEVSRKHLMGGAINAAALGRVGVLIGWTEEKLRAMFRVRRYLMFLGSVDKPTMNIQNLFILSREQAAETLSCE